MWCGHVEQGHGGSGDVHTALNTSPLQLSLTAISACAPACPRCSGTTGDPKGVQMSHRNFVAGVAGAGELLHESGIQVCC